MRQFLYAVIPAILLFVACKNDSRSKSFGFSSESMMQAPPPPPYDGETDNLVVADPGRKSIEGEPEGNAVITTGSNAVSVNEKKIIKEGSIVFETNNIKATRKIITDSLKRLGGYVGEERESNNSEVNRKEYTLSIRIPAQNFEKFLNTVSTSADRIESKNISSRDVTTEYIDVTTRLNNQKLLENRYKDLLQKASKMADVLEVENKLSEIRTNIEATQGQLNYLNKQVAYSSLDVTFFIETAIKGGTGNGFSYKFKRALGDSWELLEGLFFGIITLWPVLLVIGVIVWLARIWLRKRRSKKVITSAP